ncbi:hypothetical protein ACEPAF_2469 [Sanghuangporus sanghuang]
MLSMLGFQTTPIPFGRKAQNEAQKHPSNSFLSRGRTTQPQQRGSQNGSTYYVFSSSGSYVLESQRPPLGHAGHSSTSAPTVNIQSNPAPRPEFRTSPSTQQVVTTGDRSNSKNTSPGRSFNIYPDTSNLDSFIYERSEADSDALTLYSNASVETLQFPAADTSTQISQPSAARRSSREPDSPHPLPISLPSSSSSLVVASQSRQLPRNVDDGPRSRVTAADSGPNARRNSGSDHERPVTAQSGPSPTRSSPPHSGPGGRFPERSNTMPNFPTGPREVLPIRRNSDPTTQGDSARKRRLSGAVIPTGFGVLPRERLSPTNGRESTAVVPAGLGTTERLSPPVVRGPSPDSKRERYSPEREVSPTSSGFVRERRMSGAGASGFPAPPPGSFYDRDRPPLRRGSQSSASTSSRGHSPQDEAPRGVVFATGPLPTIRSRTISQGRISKDDAPRQIFVAGLETSKMVRFSENLICPSPIPPERRRKGWYNKRGDQLWTNDGIFVSPDPGNEYPLDLAEYPEPGTGWQNEEGIRIDMHHRLIPKAPLRPALKRGSSSTASQTLPGRPENRTTLNVNSIREEA